MSDEKPKTEDGAAKGGSLVGTIVIFLVLTLVASSVGFGASVMLADKSDTDEMKPSAAASHDAKASDHDEEMAAGEAGDEAHASDDQMKGEKSAAKGGDDEEVDILSLYAKPLPSILTNLAHPSKVWVRLELAVVTKEGATEKLLETIHQDLFAFMRTVKLHHVEGPSGFLNLKAELKNRAKIRSRGKVKDVLIRTLLFE